MAATNHLGQFIKECRSSLGYTSRKVEELTRARPGLRAISHSNLLAMEKGTYVPAFDKVLTLAAIFNVPTQHFEDRLRKDMLGASATATSDTYEALAAEAEAWREEGQHARALELYTAALAVALADSVSPPKTRSARTAESRLQAANCRMRLGLLRVAKEDLEEVLASEDAPPPVAVRASFVLAEIYRQLRNYRLALLHGKAAAELAAGAGETVLRAKTLNLLANILDDRGERDEAVAYYREALSVFESLGNRRAVGLVARNLGTTFFRLGDAESAIGYLERGLAVARTEGDRRGAAYGLANLSRAWILKGDLDLARELAREAKEIAQAEGFPDVLFTSVFHLWKIATAEGQQPLARVYADRLTALYRKLEGRSDEAEEWALHVTQQRKAK